MANTARMGWPAISEFANPWFDAWTALLNSLDNSGFASREDRHFLIRGGGTFTFDASLETLSWDQAIEIASPIAGFILMAAAGSVSMAEGDVLYVNLVRRPTQNQTITFASASQVPNTDEAMALAFRRNDRVYFFNGGAIDDGVPADIIESLSSGGGGGAPTGPAGGDLGGTYPNPSVAAITETGGPTQLVLGAVADGQILQRSGATLIGVAAPSPSLTLPYSMAHNETTDQPTFETIGAFPLDASTFTNVRLLSVAAVTGGALTGEVQLYNLTDGAAVVTNTYAGVTTPTKVLSANLVLPAGEKIYEVRHRVTGGTPPADRITTSWAGLEIDT